MKVAMKAAEDSRGRSGDDEGGKFGEGEGGGGDEAGDDCEDEGEMGRLMWGWKALRDRVGADTVPSESRMGGILFALEAVLVKIGGLMSRNAREEVEDEWGE